MNALMRRLQEWYKDWVKIRDACFDRRAGVLLKPLALVMCLDAGLTLLGQREAYWNHFAKYITPFSGGANELALFGIGEFLLSVHPLVFSGLFAAYAAFMYLLVLHRHLKKRKGIYVGTLLVLHAGAAFDWLDTIALCVFKNIPDAVMADSQQIWLLKIFYVFFLAYFTTKAWRAYRRRMRRVLH